jgi:hypothetical protein
MVNSHSLPGRFRKTRWGGNGHSNGFPRMAAIGGAADPANADRKEGN